MILNINFWRNRSVLITGHTGFKGSWLSLLLKNFDSKITGISLEPESSSSLYEEASISNVNKQISF